MQYNHNMWLELILNLYIFVCSLIGSIFGIVYVLKGHNALFVKMINLSVLCLMLSGLYQIVYIITHNELSNGFHIGILSIIGSFMFIFSANFGQMDSLVDDRSKKFLKVRLISLSAPITVVLLYLAFYMKVNNAELRIVYGVVSVFVALSSYYNFKHIIIYDVDLGIIRSIRMYNVLAVIYALFGMLKPIGLYADIKPLYIISCIGIGAVAVSLLPVLKGGVEKWTK